MKPQLEDLTIKKGRSAFWAITLQQPRFGFFWHYHPEYELTWIVRGRGWRMVGDNQSPFEAGDWVLLGPGLPHTWVSDSSEEGVEAVVVQFSSELIQRFTDLEGFETVKNLLSQSVRGLHFSSNQEESLKTTMRQLPKTLGADRLLMLVQLLHRLSQQSRTPLASPHYQTLTGSLNQSRINQVCQYIQEHAANPISLIEVASLISLTPSAFCKFFKRITGKTFSDYVNDVRIAHIRYQLKSTDLTIAEIAYANGFDSLTYFNRVFRKKTALTPRAYREQHRPAQPSK